ncbi:protein of unknown function DUF91 [Ignisphaera aggregans DSM 17230]|uniref:Endonuclease NucS n=1 Tax=Ignisphaera aggregans (strain DSM 17230 / JCM 13409 / AQ1.S1) TaxID=583356 RepID=E0SP28_IGNAA|nr:protein of unknown function DUF91 [Ignisphaera aggregans DSM 17230]
MICRDVATSNCEDIKSTLESAKKRNVILIVGRTTIEYIGRAASESILADRLVIIKPDGSLLIHEATKVEPFNWQPPRSIINFECINDKLRLKSIRLNPHEEVLVDFDYIDFIKICNISTTKLRIIGRESDVVSMIMNNVALIDKDSSIIGIDIPTPYGKIDILLKRSDGTFIVVEVKNEKAGVPAVIQLKRYVEFYKSKGYNVIGILIANDITDDAYSILMKEGFKFVNLSSIITKPRDMGKLDKFLKT